MQTRTLLHALVAACFILVAPAGAAPRLDIGPLSRRLGLPGLTACYVARMPGASGAGLRFLSTGTTLYRLDPNGSPWPVLYRVNLYGVVSDPQAGILICTSRGVYATRDGWYYRRISGMVFTKVVAAPVGGLFARLGAGLYGFDGERFQLIRVIPWRSIESLAVEPGGAVWFVGTYTRSDGGVAPTRLYVSRDRDGQPVIEDPLPPTSSVSAVAEYFGGIMATVDGQLQGTDDGGANWITFDWFGRTDLTLTSVPLSDGQPWQALWIGVRDVLGGPAPLWFDDYASGLVAEPIDALQVLNVTADPWSGSMLFVADDALFEAPYHVLDDAPSVQSGR
jgi:hypothetical protein